MYASADTTFTYDAKGQIGTWKLLTGDGTLTRYDMTYDSAGQLTSSVYKIDSTSAVLNQCYYNYDSAGNRVSEQVDATVTQATPTPVNKISSYSAGGATRFQGVISEPGTVKVNGVAAAQSTSTNFVANPVLNAGNNTVSVVATDGSGNAQTNNYQVVVPSGATVNPLYNDVGNLTDNGLGQTYAWDVENRLITITYTGGATSNFTYDGLGQRVKIVEKDSAGNAIITKQFVWAGGERPLEERDASGTTVTKQFFAQGEVISGANFFYTFDHLGSVREVSDASGNFITRYAYDPYGRSTNLNGGQESDFQYAGYCKHQASSLNLTLYRAYDPNTARWLSRDPSGTRGGINLYLYTANSPFDLIDPMGLCGSGVTLSIGIGAGGQAGMWGLPFLSAGGSGPVADWGAGGSRPPTRPTFPREWSRSTRSRRHRARAPTCNRSVRPGPTGMCATSGRREAY